MNSSPNKLAVRLAAFCIAFLVLPQWAAADDASQWLEKMIKIYDKAPFSMDTHMEMKMNQGGRSFGMEAKGTLFYGDQRHMRMNLEIDMSVPGMVDGMKMSNLVVSDGITMWTEMDNPIAGGKQVMKADLAKIEKMAAAQGFGGLMGGGGDPVSQLRALGDLLDFEVVEQRDGEVVLAGEPTDEYREKLGPALAMMGGGVVRLVLEEKTGYPLRMFMGPEEAPVLTMEFANLEFLTKSQLPDGVFDYKPPAGVRVIDAPLPQ